MVRIRRDLTYDVCCVKGENIEGKKDYKYCTLYLYTLFYSTAPRFTPVVIGMPEEQDGWRCSCVFGIQCCMHASIDSVTIEPTEPPIIHLLPRQAYLIVESH